MEIDIYRLRQTETLAAVPDELLRDIGKWGTGHRFRRGEYIFREGAPCDSMYLIVEGEAEIVKAMDGREVFVARLGPGHPVGEMGLLEGVPRPVSARAVSGEVALVRLERAAVMEWVSQQPAVVFESLKWLSSRLRVTDILYVRELQQKNEELADANRRLHESYHATLATLCQALDLRDRMTKGHSQRVAAYSLHIAGEMGLDEGLQEAIRLGALLHDIGKIGVSDTILRKPTRLNPLEWLEMQNHPLWGKQIIQDVSFLSRALDVVYAHHEWWDGSGYPRGLRGEEIPIQARVFAAADVFDALTTERPYKSAWAPQRARDQVVRESGTHFDPRVVEAFLYSLPEILEIMQVSAEEDRQGVGAFMVN